ncbi:hypothetical protein ACOSP7_030154 [Xanthoceras sorbifolium]
MKNPEMMKKAQAEVDETGVKDMKFLKLVIKETMRLHPPLPLRICPGIPFGVANVELPLAMLLYHFDWKLPNKSKHEDLNMTETFGVTVRREEDLYAIPIPYHP